MCRLAKQKIVSMIRKYHNHMLQTNPWHQEEEPHHEEKHREVKQGKFVEFISPRKGYFRETYKSQNINPISPTPKFTLGIIQI